MGGHASIPVFKTGETKRRCERIQKKKVPRPTDQQTENASVGASPHEEESGAGTAPETRRSVAFAERLSTNNESSTNLSRFHRGLSTESERIRIFGTKFVIR